jgi:phage portal protein BeeE
MRGEDPSAALSVSIKDSLARDVVMTFGVPTQLVGLPGTDTYNNLGMARVGFLTDTVLPGYVNLYTAGLNHALLSVNGGAAIEPDLDRLPAMIAARLQLTETASKATMLSVNEQRALLGYPAYDDEHADVPVLLEQLKLKRLAIEVGNLSNILSPSER